MEAWRRDFEASSEIISSVADVGTTSPTGQRKITSSSSSSSTDVVYEDFELSETLPPSVLSSVCASPPTPLLLDNFVDAPEAESTSRAYVPSMFSKRINLEIDTDSGIGSDDSKCTGGNDPDDDYVDTDNYAPSEIQFPLNLSVDHMGTISPYARTDADHFLLRYLRHASITDTNVARDDLTLDDENPEYDVDNLEEDPELDTEDMTSISERAANVLRTYRSMRQQVEQIAGETTAIHNQP
jgi:hypothetical protein